MAKTLLECKISLKKREVFNKIGIFDSDDLLSYYPFRYEQQELKPYEDWQIKDKIIVEGRVITAPRNIRFKGSKTMTKFQIENDDDVFEIVLFNRPWASKMDLGQTITIVGKYDGKQKITAIQYNFKPISEQLGIFPVYPLKNGLTQNAIVDSIKRCFETDGIDIHDDVPSLYQQKYRLLNKKTALYKIHFPNSQDDIKQALRTLKYEEFLKFHLAIQCIREQNNEDLLKEGKIFNVDDIFGLANHLPFHMTKDQVKVVGDIVSDLQSKHVMYRLVQGDVGCGKTLVAVLALYACFLSGHQGALLAPTEILAKQHYITLKNILRTTNIKVEVLYSALSTIKKKEILENLKNGEIDCIVGTHSLIQDDVEFKNLGLVVADEQHRFGVEQRKKLIQKGDKVDFLLMTATPIPRTLANTLYGDMDISTIETLPEGRKEVRTSLIQANSFITIYDEVVDTIENGNQVYVVCSAIDESENYNARNVKQIYDNLVDEFKGVASVGLLHGKLSSEEKEQIMHDFELNRIQILVTTTVIEVGVNVVNATMMIIYDAHRFGLSQLHQLRGRVQRGSQQGSCFLLTDSTEPLSIERLNVLVKMNNGFEIALEDLRLRGPGDILGTRQSGLPAFLLGNLVEDTKIIETAKNDAVEIMNNSKLDENKKIINCVLSLNKVTNNYMD